MEAPGHLALLLLPNHGSDTHLRCLYWFCDDCLYNSARRHAGATTKMWSMLCLLLAVDFAVGHVLLAKVTGQAWRAWQTCGH